MHDAFNDAARPNYSRPAHGGKPLQNSNPYCGSSYCNAVSGSYITGWSITSGNVEQLNGYIGNIPGE